MAKELTKKQQVFVAEYLKDMNGTRAYVAAGYSSKGAEAGAARLLANVKVKAQIEQKLTKRCEKLGISADYVLDGIRETVEICKEPGVLFDPKAALKGYELLGKHLKLFTEKVEHSGEVNTGGLTDEERAAKIAILLNAAKSRKHAQ